MRVSDGEVNVGATTVRYRQGDKVNECDDSERVRQKTAIYLCKRQQGRRQRTRVESRATTTDDRKFNKSYDRTIPFEVN